jgi:hypothetical protein
MSWRGSGDRLGWGLLCETLPFFPYVTSSLIFPHPTQPTTDIGFRFFCSFSFSPTDRAPPPSLSRDPFYLDSDDDDDEDAYSAPVDDLDGLFGAGDDEDDLAMADVMDEEGDGNGGMMIISQEEVERAWDGGGDGGGGGREASGGVRRE